jgi:hypothetical protein
MTLTSDAPTFGDNLGIALRLLTVLTNQFGRLVPVFVTINVSGFMQNIVIEVKQAQELMLGHFLGVVIPASWAQAKTLAQ